MKNRLLLTFKQYRPLFISNIVFVLLILAIGSGIDRAGAGEIISSSQLGLLLLIPIYFVVHGIFSCKLTKKVWLPNLFLFLMLAGWLGIAMVGLKFSLFYLLVMDMDWLVLPMICTAISVVASLVAYPFLDRNHVENSEQNLSEETKEPQNILTAKPSELPEKERQETVEKNREKSEDGSKE